MVELTVHGRNAVVVGAGGSGRAAARLLARCGCSVRLVERNPEAVDETFRAEAKELGVNLLFGEHTREQFEDSNLVVMSPGIPVVKIAHLFPGGDKGFGPEVMSELELAWRFVSEPVLAITGTSGKTTTTGIAAAMLEEAGRKVFVGGNIGTPLSEYILSGESADILVLEVSSFQLQLCDLFKPRVAVLLNITPNHLDYHADMEEYLEAKLKIFARQEQFDLAVIPCTLKDELAGKIPERVRARCFSGRDRFHCPALRGAHNQENMEAAFMAVKYFGVGEQQAQDALDKYAPPPHRLETVDEINGVLFVDDSKATTIDAMRVALQAMDRPVLLLAGGVFKGGSPEELLPLLTEKVRAVGLYGAGKDVFEKAWKGNVDLFWEPTLEQAMKRLWKMARGGEAVLLSPATSSFDQYSDYKARGEDFKRVARGFRQ